MARGTHEIIIHTPKFVAVVNNQIQASAEKVDRFASGGLLLLKLVVFILRHK
jgi:hypothetical protein